MSLWSCPVSALAHISTAQPVAGPYGPHWRTKAGNHLMSGGARDCRHLSAVPCLAETGQVFNPPTSGLALSVLRIEKPCPENAKKSAQSAAWGRGSTWARPRVSSSCVPCHQFAATWSCESRLKGLKAMWTLDLGLRWPKTSTAVTCWLFNQNGRPLRNLQSL